MKKRISAFALVLVLLLPLLTVPVSAIKPPYERLEAVDYSRILPEGRLSKEVVLSVGTKEFKGSIQLGKTLTQDEQDTIIRQVMLDQKITVGMLIRAKYIIAKVEQNTGFDMEFVTELGLKFAMSGLGVDNLMDIYDVITGQQELTGTAVNMVLGEIVSRAAEYVFSPVIAFVVNGLFASGETVGRKIADVMRESEEAQEAIEKTVMLNVFYNECNRRLRAAELEKGKGSFLVSVNDHGVFDETLFEIPVKQHWQVTCELFREDTYGDQSDPTNYSGIYRGNLQIEIWHELENFDAQFLDNIAMKYPLVKQFAAVGSPTTRRGSEPSELRKRLRNTSTVEVHLNTRNMTSKGMMETIPMRDFEDLSYFKVDHLIRQGHPSSLWDENGHLDMTFQTEKGPERVQCNYYYEHRFGAELQMGNRYPAVTVQNVDYFGDMTLSGPFSSYVPLFDAKHELGFPFLVDYQIFSDLQRHCAVLHVTGG